MIQKIKRLYSEYKTTRRKKKQFDPKKYKKMTLNAPYFPIIFDEHFFPRGFGSYFLIYLGLLQYCETNNLELLCRFESRAFTEDNAIEKDFFSYFFDKPILTDKLILKHQLTPIHVNTSEELGIDANKLTVPEAISFVQKHIQLTPDITTEIDEFIAAHFTGHVLGLHYRGTDKQTGPYADSGKVSFDQLTTTLQTTIQAHPDIQTLFISSDEQPFIDQITEWRQHHAPTIKTAIRKDKFRSTDGKPIHYSGQSTHSIEKARDAIINIVLLSKCTTLIKSSSYFSSISYLFNPKLNVIMLNEAHTNLNFIEKELIKLKR